MKLLLCSLLFPLSVSATELTVGLTHFNSHGDGVWWQQPFPHTLNLNSPSIGIGWSNGSWRYGYTYVGKYSTSAVAVASDDAYNKWKASGYKGDVNYPISHWYGSGEIHSFYFTRKLDFGKLFVETGVSAYIPTWEMHIPDYYWNPEKPPIPLTVKHKRSLTLSPLIGIGKDFGTSSVALTFRRPNTKGDEWTSIANKWAATLEVRFELSK